MDVNGKDAAPVYTFLKDTAPSGGFLGSLLGRSIKWNFAKFLVRGSDGVVVSSSQPTSFPLSFEKDIVELLK